MAKKSALTFGIIFLIAGIWGFVQSPILGLFAADPISSIIHIIVGIVLIVLAFKPAASSALRTLGIIYVLFAIVGFVQQSKILFFATNGASNWLYLVLGILMFAFGYSAKKGMAAAAPTVAPL